MGDYRIPGEMSKAKNARTIFGPVGGAQITPDSLKIYEKNIITAKIRELVNASCSVNPFYIKKIRAYTDVIASNDETYQHVELVIVDVPNALNWFREKHSAFHHMYYILWQHWAWLWVKHSGIRFDVIHHVTMNDYRIPSEMYKAKGAKVIWGPMGGAQVTPKPLKVYEKNQFAAAFREFVNKSCSWNPFYKKALRSYYKIYCINNETQKQISRIVGKDVPLMPELALRDEYKNLPTPLLRTMISSAYFTAFFSPPRMNLDATLPRHFSRSQSKPWIVLTTRLPKSFGIQQKKAGPSAWICTTSYLPNAL